MQELCDESEARGAGGYDGRRTDGPHRLGGAGPGPQGATDRGMIGHLRSNTCSLRVEELGNTCSPLATPHADRRPHPPLRAHRHRRRTRRAPRRHARGARPGGGVGQPHRRDQRAGRRGRRASGDAARRGLRALPPPRPAPARPGRACARPPSGCAATSSRSAPASSRSSRAWCCSTPRRSSGSCAGSTGCCARPHAPPKASPPACGPGSERRSDASRRRSRRSAPAPAGRWSSVRTAPRRSSSSLPVDALTPVAPELRDALGQLGIRRLAEVRALGRLQLRDRFGPDGERAYRLAAGEDSDRLDPRPPPLALRETLALPEPAATEQALWHALRLLLDRLLARPERASRAPRSLLVGARLQGGGSWERHVPLREATADRARLELALRPKLRRAARTGRPARRRARSPGAGRPPARAAPLGRRGAVRADRRGRAAGAQRGRRARRPADRRGRRREPRARAPLRPGSGVGVTCEVRPAPGRCCGSACPSRRRRDRRAGRAGAHRRPRRSRRCADAGSSRRAGGPTSRSAAATSRPCSRAAGWSRCSRTSWRADGACSRTGDALLRLRRAALPLGLLVPRRRLAARGAGRPRRGSSATTRSR